jgi:pimeloyl-ACP methyl ester carboxylesterase
VNGFKIGDFMNILGSGHTTQVRGTHVAWGEMGDGYPLVLLHGLADSHRTWRRAAPLLAKRFRVLMPDLTGFGYSGRPDVPYTLTWHAGVISDWMGAIGVEKAHFCGHSYGGGIAEWMLLEYRNRVDRLALVSAGGLGREVTIGLRLASVPMFGRRLSPFVLRFVAPAVLQLSPGMFGHMEPWEIATYLQWNSIPGTARAFQRTVEGVINFFGQYLQMTQRADEICEMPPIALFWGDRDIVIPVEHAREILKFSENIALKTYRRCGHYPHLDVPEIFVKDLAGFLEDPDRRPAVINVPPERKWLFFSEPAGSSFRRVCEEHDASTSK